jgi:AI-2 transport protein TqsA
MADKRSEGAWLMRGSMVVIAGVAIAMVLLYTRAVMIPFVLAVFIVILVGPVLDFLIIRLRFPRICAVAVALFVVIVIISLFFVVALQAIQMIVSTAGRYSADFADLADRAFARLTAWGLEVERQKIVADLRNQIPQFVTDTLGTAFSFFSSLLFVLIFVMFLLAGRNPYLVRSGVYADIDHKVRRYVATKVIMSIATGVLVWIALRAIGLELAGVFGILAFLLNFVPAIGSVVATLLPIPIAAAQFQSTWLVVLAVAIPAVIQVVLGNVLESKFTGTGLNLHPVTILLALSFWGLLWGIPGMFLAAPMTAGIRIVLMQFDTLKPVGNLLAGKLPSSTKGI